MPAWQILRDAPGAKPPAAQAGAAHAGIAFVADIARAGHAGDDLHDLGGSAAPRPAAFAQLEIGRQLAGARGKAGDIGQRQFIESGRIERMGATARGLRRSGTSGRFTPYSCHTPD
jgi:hypothetical protein